MAVRSEPLRATSVTTRISAGAWGTASSIAAVQSVEQIGDGFIEIGEVEALGRWIHLFAAYPGLDSIFDN